jgi:hypothetical protein
MKFRYKLSQSTILLALGLCSVAVAQDRDRDRLTRIEPGTNLSVRTNQFINSDRGDNRIYTATVTQDVRGSNGRLAIPRGSQAELIVRVARDNDLILDLESVTVNGQRYGIQSDPNRVESRPDDSLVGAIIGSINGGQVRGREVRLGQGTLLTFRLDRPLVVGVVDRGEDRGGYHYHDEDRDRERLTRIEPGTNIAVRTNQFIDSDRGDNRVYYGSVVQDVRGANGRLAIPAGSQVEMMVRVARDNDLILDLESVNVNGQRYGIQSDVNRVESRRDDSLVGALVGAINGGQARGREVRIGQGTVLTFRLERPLVVGVARRFPD